MNGFQPRRIARFAALTIMICGCLRGAPPLTTIQDVLYKADGSRFHGIVFIEWKSFEAADSSAIMTQSLTVQIINGSLKVQLVPTTNAASSAYYSVRYNSDGRVQFEEVWHVPPSSTILRLSDVRAMDSTGTEVLPGQVSTEVQMSDVIGLMAEMASRPVKSPVFTSSRAVLINASGELESVSGDSGNCVHVDGTSGPCSTSPAFIDGEVPSGSVDGVNAAFTLVNSPDPAGSLSLYRNGVLQKPGFDYSITGASITFVSTAIPQSGDTLLASYRVGSAASLAYLNSVAPSAQVLCGGQGVATSATVNTALGACTIPAGTLQAGDRVDIRADYGHAGTGVGFSFEVKWGTSTLATRAASASDHVATLKGDAAIVVGGAAWSVQSWGTLLGFLAGAGSASDPVNTDLTISFMGRMAGQTTETVALQGYTVLRYPARIELTQ
ncbi:MAG: hypothetical protein LLG20_01665 [Acidobacteriales bacterium]|nr:hypothetical protein [Terriglobales bacterium]